MPKYITQKINLPKALITISLSNNDFRNISDLVTFNFSEINNGIFIKNNSNNTGEDISIKINNVSNSTNIIELINNDSIFFEATNISDVQLKGNSSNPRSVSIFIN